jgi:hypothetical protein
MKYLLFIISFLASNNIVSQTNCNKDSSLYLSAFYYIIQLENKNIELSDSIVDIDRFYFSDLLVDFPTEKEKIKKYRSAKDFTWFNSYFCEYLHNLKCQEEFNGNNVLFFSQIEDNILIAELLPKSNKDREMRFNYEYMTFQNIGKVYLFIFDSCNNIKEMFQNNIIYD